MKRFGLAVSWVFRGLGFLYQSIAPVKYVISDKEARCERVVDRRIKSTSLVKHACVITEDLGDEGKPDNDVTKSDGGA